MNGGWFRVMRGGARAGMVVGAGMATALNNQRFRARGRRTGGYLPPGAGAPPPNAADYHDYRGAATWTEVRGLEHGTFPLGMFADLQKRRFRGPIGIEGNVVGRHAVVVGPSGSGKTRGLIVPWIHAALAAGWAVVAVDVTDLLEQDLQEHCAVAGPLHAPVARWDYTRPGDSDVWEWLRELTSEGRVDGAVTAVLGKRDANRTVDPYFYQRDYKTLRGLLLFTAACIPNARTAGHLVQILRDDQKLDGVVKRNARAPGAAELMDALRWPAAEWPKIVSGVETALSAFDVGGATAITRAQAGRRRLDLGAALEQNQLLIVGAPLEGGQVSEALSGLFLSQLKQRIFERYGRGTSRPTLLVVDEAPQVAGRVDLRQLFEVGRRAGVATVLAMQDVAQLENENERSTILSNAATMAVLPGSSPVTVEEFSKRLGHRPAETLTYTHQPGPQPGWRPVPMGTAHASQVVPVLGTREITAPPVGDRPALVHVKASDARITNKPLLVELSV